MSINTISNKQIVTVAVITYHSAATVLETLDSIISQSYRPENIELIISDDGSKDNTVSVINDWLAQHQAKFHSVKLFANEVNGGISKNCNVAWKAATSEWIKTIAGDDILVDACVSDYMEYINGNSTAKVVVSKMQSFYTGDDGVKVFDEIYPSPFQQGIFSLQASEQFKIIAAIDGLNVAPSAFLNKGFLSEIGYADVRFPMIEDYPIWFKCTKKGNKIHYLNDVTVFYRVGNSASQSSTQLVNISHINNRIKIDDELVFKLMRNKMAIARRKLSYSICSIALRFSNDKKNIVSLALYRLSLLIKPYWLRDRFSMITQRRIN